MVIRKFNLPKLIELTVVLHYCGIIISTSMKMERYLYCKIVTHLVLYMSEIFNTGTHQNID